MKLDLSEAFKKKYKKIKDKKLRERIFKKLQKIESFPEIGKPLKGNLKGTRTVRVVPFRILYRLEGDLIVVLDFNHRKSVYED